MPAKAGIQYVSLLELGNMWRKTDKNSGEGPD